MEKKKKRRVSVSKIVYQSIDHQKIITALAVLGMRVANFANVLKSVFFFVFFFFQANSLAGQM
jgi:hypothetical protein